MNKTNFLRSLRNELAPLTSQEQEQIIEEYISIFDIKSEEGLSENEVCLELGDPHEIGRKFLEEFNYDGIQYQGKGSHVNSEYAYRSSNKKLFVAMIIFHFLIGFWLFFSAWAFIAAMYFSALCCWIVPFMLMFTGNVIFIEIIACLLVCIGLGMLFLAFANFLAVRLIKMTKVHLNWLKNLL